MYEFNTIYNKLGNKLLAAVENRLVSCISIIALPGTIHSCLKFVKAVASGSRAVISWGVASLEGWLPCSTRKAVRHER